MSATLLDPPGTAASLPLPSMARPPASPRRQTPPGWIFAAALAISALINSLVLLSFDIRLLPLPRALQDITLQARGERANEMRIYEVIPGQQTPGLTLGTSTAGATGERTAPAAATPRPLQPAAPPATRPGAPPPMVIRQPEEVVTRDAQPGSAGAANARGGSVAERIGPTMSDPRLWVGAPPLPPPAEAPVSAHEAYRALLAERIGTLNDSLRLVDAAAARAVDWTVKDKNGGRWGVSPKGIHLGGITLPIPVQFATPAGRRDDAAATMRNWSEIQAQRGREDAREGIKERIKAINERKQAERKDTTRTSGSR